jgi:hypothetical protein
VKLSRAWRLGGLIYTLVVVVAVVLRLWRPSSLPPQVVSATITFSDFSTLPPFFAGIGLYPGLLAADVLRQLTGLPAHVLLSGVVWLAIVVCAVAVAAMAVFLAHTIWRFIRRVSEKASPSVALTRVRARPHRQRPDTPRRVKRDHAGMSVSELLRHMNDHVLQGNAVRVERGGNGRGFGLRLVPTCLRGQTPFRLTSPPARLAVVETGAVWSSNDDHPLGTALVQLARPLLHASIMRPHVPSYRDEVTGFTGAGLDLRCVFPALLTDPWVIPGRGGRVGVHRG